MLIQRKYSFNSEILHQNAIHPFIHPFSVTHGGLLASNAQQLLLGDPKVLPDQERYNTSSIFWVCPVVSYQIDTPITPLVGGCPGQVPKPSWLAHFGPVALLLASPGCLNS